MYDSRRFQELETAVPEDKFKKSNSYGADKLSFGRFEASFMFIEGIALVLLGWMPFVWDFSYKFCRDYSIINDDSSPMYTEIAVTCIFVSALMVHDLLISLPFSLYSTFVVEEKHGFNKSVSGTIHPTPLTLRPSCSFLRLSLFSSEIRR